MTNFDGNDTGYKTVLIPLDSSINKTGTPPSNVQMIAMRGNYSNAAGTIKNIRFNNYADVTVEDGKGSMKNAVIGSLIPMVATPADGYMLDSWTDDEDNVVSTEESFLYEVEGDVTLVYPNVTRYDADFKFCATYRLIATKEGVDDYNYICYAQSLIDAMASGSEKTAAQNNLNECVDSMVNQSADRAVVNSSAANARTARATLVALIESLQ